MTTSIPEALYDVQFDRSYGIQHIDLPDGTVVTSVSQPDWPTFTKAMRSTALAEEPGNFIVTPELIGAVGINMRGSFSLRQQMQAREYEARELSKQFPHTTLLLGTIALSGGERPRNVVQFIRSGEIIDETPKVNYQGFEYDIFDRHVTAADVCSPPSSNILNIIGGDLQLPPPILRNINTLVISACWGLPQLIDGADRQREKDLTYNIQRMFARNNSVETVIMVDRDPLRTNGNGRPFNAVARRIQENEPR
jgi:hypothetical protein